jgi:hypothetical protein
VVCPLQMSAGFGAGNGKLGEIGTGVEGVGKVCLRPSRRHLTVVGSRIVVVVEDCLVGERRGVVDEVVGGREAGIGLDGCPGRRGCGTVFGPDRSSRSWGFGSLGLDADCGRGN